ncbi:MAG: fibrobacter succinogenes major paralogous domain-containing protein [Bacteroidota bacterium]
MKTQLLALAILLNVTVSFAQLTSTFTDARDGKVYKTVQIGKQIWMAENLAYKAGSGCWAYGDNAENVARYGYLYDFETAITACPPGWHVPTDEEWNVLTEYLGNQDSCGRKLKSGTGWSSPNDTLANSTKFTALPGGLRFMGGTYDRLGVKGFWWSSTESESHMAWYRSILSDDNKVNRYDDYKDYGLSVRCIKD